VFVSIPLLSWRANPPPNFTKLPYVQGFCPIWSTRTMASFDLYCKIYGNDVNNIRQICRHIIYIKLSFEFTTYYCLKCGTNHVNQ
jgi:hypothetical protein